MLHRHNVRLLFPSRIRLLRSVSAFRSQHTLKAITEGMESRTQSLLSRPEFIPEIQVDLEKRAPFFSTPELRPGDVVLIQLEPMVLLSAPSVPSGLYTLVDRVGRVTTTSLSLIDLKITKLLSASILESHHQHLFADSLGSSLQIAENESQNGACGSDNISAVVSVWVYRLVSQPLRTLTEKSYTRANQLIPHVTSVISELQKSQLSPILPFSELLASVYRRRVFSPIEIVSARICLEHESVRGKFDMNLSCLVPSTLRMASLGTERAHKSALQGKNSRKLVSDYACNNVSDPMLQSSAIQNLRLEFPNVELMSPSMAAEVLEIPCGGAYNNHWHSWIFSLPRPEFGISDDSCPIRLRFPDSVYSVDSSNALEIDDGISIKALSSTLVRLGIHVANPSAFVDPRFAVNEIKQLPSSVYLQGGGDGRPMNVSMLPERFAPRFDVSKRGAPALALFADLDLVSGEVSNVVFQHVTLDRPVAVTPEQFSEISIPEFTLFWDAAQRLLRNRVLNGAIGVKKYADDPTGLLDTSKQAAGTTVVTEFMLLANHLAGKFCLENNIPTFYRGQTIAISNASLRQLYTSDRAEQGGLLGVKWRPFIQRGYTSVRPVSHDGVGFAVTSRFTSPLRRMDDFVTHAQLDAWLCKRSLPFTHQELEQMMDYNDAAQYWVRHCEKTEAQFYHLQDLKRRVEAGVTTVRGVVSSMRPTAFGIVEISVLLPEFSVEAEYVGSRALSLEEALDFRVRHVSPEGMYVHVE